MTTGTGLPERIVCLTEETTETLYLLGEGDRVVGISGYTVRPPEARAGAVFGSGSPAMIVDESDANYMINSAADIGSSYDVSGRGRLLMERAVDSSPESGSLDLTIVQNWADELRRLVPTP